MEQPSHVPRQEAGSLVVRNLLSVLGTQAPTLGVAAAYSILLARGLGPSTFGAYVVIWAALSLAAIAVEEAVGASAARGVARAPDRAAEQLSNGLLLAAAAGLGGSLPVPLLALLAGAPVAPAALAATILWVRTPTMLLSGGLSGRQKVHLSAGLALVTTLANAVVGAAVVLAGGGLLPVFGAAVAANAATLALAWRLTRREVPGVGWRLVSRAGLAEFARRATPFGLRALIRSAQFRVDALLLSALAGLDAASAYRAASKFLDLGQALPTAVGQAVFPLASALHARDPGGLRAVFHRQLTFLAAVGLPGSVLLCWLAGPLVRLVYGPAYAGAAPVLAVLSGAVFLSHLEGAVASVVTTGERQSRVTALSLVGTVAVVVFGLLLVPPLGAVGAAWAAVGSRLAVLLAFSTLLPGYVGPGLPRPLAVVLLAGAGATALGAALSLLAAPLALLALPAYAVALRARGVPSAEERDLVGQALRRPRRAEPRVEP